VRHAETGVQRNRLPHSGDPLFGHAMVSQKAGRSVGTVDFEPLIAVRIVGDTKVMQDTPEEYHSSS
jgi:hypothetical protein